MKWLLLIAGMACSISVQADTVRFESGTKQKVMIELFTSQGCSSCPPAEEYLNSFSTHPDLWKKYIPVALHVDYWDYLGWKDKFSKPQHSSRQREYARINRTRTVFTPAFFVNGINWRPGFWKKPPAPAQREVGNLKVKVSGNKVTASFKEHGKTAEKLELTIVVAGMDLRTKIERGENSGRYSKHSFVLLGQRKLAKQKSGDWSGQLPDLKNFNAGRYALIAWVSQAGLPAPIQATGGYLPFSIYKDGL